MGWNSPIIRVSQQGDSHVKRIILHHGDQRPKFDKELRKKKDIKANVRKVEHL